jgi:hypothetical protein
MEATDPRAILKSENISEKLLSADALKSLALYDRALTFSKKNPTSEDMRKNAERAGELAIQVIQKEIAVIQSDLKKEAETEEKKIQRKAQSKKIKEKSDVVLDDLALCREKLKEDRKRKMDSGEIKPRAKKTLVTRLRIELLKTATLIPKNLKDNADVIAKTQKALLSFLNELKSIWGLNKIKSIQDELKEKFKKLEKDAA